MGNRTVLHPIYIILIQTLLLSVILLANGSPFFDASLSGLNKKVNNTRDGVAKITTKIGSGLRSLFSGGAVSSHPGVAINISVTAGGSNTNTLIQRGDVLSSNISASGSELNLNRLLSQSQSGNLPEEAGFVKVGGVKRNHRRIVQTQTTTHVVTANGTQRHSSLQSQQVPQDNNEYYDDENSNEIVSTSHQSGIKSGVTTRISSKTISSNIITTGPNKSSGSHRTQYTTYTFGNGMNGTNNSGSSVPIGASGASKHVVFQNSSKSFEFAVSGHDNVSSGVDKNGTTQQHTSETENLENEENQQSLLGSSSLTVTIQRMSENTTINDNNSSHVLVKHVQAQDHQINNNNTSQTTNAQPHSSSNDNGRVQTERKNLQHHIKQQVRVETQQENSENDSTEFPILVQQNQDVQLIQNLDVDEEQGLVKTENYQTLKIQDGNENEGRIQQYPNLEENAGSTPTETGQLQNHEEEGELPELETEWDQEFDQGQDQSAVTVQQHNHEANTSQLQLATEQFQNLEGRVENSEDETEKYQNTEYEDDYGQGLVKVNIQQFQQHQNHAVNSSQLQAETEQFQNHKVGVENPEDETENYQNIEFDNGHGQGPAKVSIQQHETHDANASQPQVETGQLQNHEVNEEHLHVETGHVDEEHRVDTGQLQNHGAHIEQRQVETEKYQITELDDEHNPGPVKVGASVGRHQNREVNTSHHHIKIGQFQSQGLSYHSSVAQGETPKPYNMEATLDQESVKAATQAKNAASEHRPKVNVSKNRKNYREQDSSTEPLGAEQRPATSTNPAITLRSQEFPATYSDGDVFNVTHEANVTCCPTGESPEFDNAKFDNLSKSCLANVKCEQEEIFHTMCKLWPLLLFLCFFLCALILFMIILVVCYVFKLCCNKNGHLHKQQQYQLTSMNLLPDCSIRKNVDGCDTTLCNTKMAKSTPNSPPESKERESFQSTSSDSCKDLLRRSNEKDITQANVKQEVGSMSASAHEYGCAKTMSNIPQQKNTYITTSTTTRSQDQQLNTADHASGDAQKAFTVISSSSPGTAEEKVELDVISFDTHADIGNMRKDPETLEAPPPTPTGSSLNKESGYKTGSNTALQSTTTRHETRQNNESGNVSVNTPQTESAAVSRSSRQERQNELDNMKYNFLNTTKTASGISEKQFNEVPSKSRGSLNSSTGNHNSFLDTYNRLEKRAAIERQRKDNGETGRTSSGSRGGVTTAVSNGTSFSSEWSSGKKYNGLYGTYTKHSKMHQSGGGLVLFVNSKEGWFKLNNGSSSSAVATKVDRIIQLDECGSNGSALILPSVNTIERYDENYEVITMEKSKQVSSSSKTPKV